MPLFFIALTLVVIAAHVTIGGAGSILLLRVMMGFLLAAGALGVVLHYQGSMEFQLEMDPTLSGMALVQRRSCGRKRRRPSRRASWHNWDCSASSTPIGIQRFVLVVLVVLLREPEHGLTRRCLLLVAVATMSIGAPLGAQVGKGVADLNSMPQAELAALPGMTPAAATAFVAKRPFGSITEANAFLLAQKLTQDQLNTLYTKAFVHVNLNTGTRDDILLFPARARAWRASSTSTGRGATGRTSTRRSASTCRRPRSIG